MLYVSFCLVSAACTVSATLTELDTENPDTPPYLFCHGEKIGGICVFFVTHSEAPHRVCTAL